MKKKTISLFVTMAAVIATPIFISSASNFSASLNGAVNSESTIWGHYSALDPEYEKNGSVEFWISCDDHSVVYEKPQSGTIEDRGAPSQEQITSWGSSDKRYIPQYKIDSTTMWYGYYPQSLVKDETTITALDTITEVDTKGYKTYNGDKYLKHSGVEYTDDDGETITAGDHYYKVERITWKILSTDATSAFVTSSYILDNQIYGECYEDETKSKTDYQGNTAEVYANNYKYSDLRTFLNTTFLNKAFDDTSKILTTEVDNSASTADDGFESPNPYVCENTSDKIFALSYKDLTNTSYGFSSSADEVDEARQCKPSEYARAKGVYCDLFSYCGYYWTRSPSSYGTYFASYVDHTGDLSLVYLVDGSEYGVRPGLNISIA